MKLTPLCEMEMHYTWMTTSIMLSAASTLERWRARSRAIG
jgi:hypothetical protein